MTRTTALATMLMLAALPAAAQSETEGLPPAEGIGASSLWDGRISDETPAVFYSGPMIGLPSLTDTRPSSAGDLPAPGFFILTEPTVTLNHLDFGAYEPYAPKIAREALKGIVDDKSAGRAADGGPQGLAFAVHGTSAETRFATSYVTQTGPVDVRAKASVVVPGPLSPSRFTAAFVNAGNVLLAMSYKF